MLSQLPAEDFGRLWTLNRDQAEESIAFANAFSKIYYDAKHTPVTLSRDDNVFLRLGDGYQIPGITNHKLHQQRTGPFKILDRVGPLAYRLAPTMGIHPVISIAQLEPAPKTSDPYNRIKFANPPPVVETEGQTTERQTSGQQSDVYELEAVLGKRTSRNKLQYLVTATSTIGGMTLTTLEHVLP